MEGILDQSLAVAGGGDTGNLQVGMILIQAGEDLPHQRDGVAQVGLIIGEENVLVVVDDHQLDGGGTRVDADVHRAAVGAEGQAGHGGLHVAGVELLILLLVGKQRRQADVGSGGAVLLQPLCHIVQIKGLVRVEGSTQCHVEQAVLRAGTLDVKRLVKALAQHTGEGQRSAQIEHVTLDGAALCQACNGLVDHRLIDGAGNILCQGALVDQGLDITLGKHAATAGDGVGAGGLLGRLVHLVRGHLQQGGHLVDEGAGTAGTAAVHADLSAVGQKQNLGILTAQLDDAVGSGSQALGGHTGGKHFLHKGDLAAVRQAHAGRPRDGQQCFLAVEILRLHAGQDLAPLLEDMTVVTFVCGIYQFIGVVQNNALDRGGPDIQPDSHSLIPSWMILNGSLGMRRSRPRKSMGLRSAFVPYTGGRPPWQKAAEFEPPDKRNQYIVAQSANFGKMAPAKKSALAEISA